MPIEDDKWAINVRIVITKSRFLIISIVSSKEFCPLSIIAEKLWSLSMNFKSLICFSPFPFWILIKSKSLIAINNDIIYEPSKVEIVKSLVPKYFNTQIWQYLLESFASEQAARMLAMENATENAKDMINDLNLEFNKARQTAITTEMLEIVGGAEALSN